MNLDIAFGTNDLKKTTSELTSNQYCCKCSNYAWYIFGCKQQCNE